MKPKQVEGRRATFNKKLLGATIRIYEHGSFPPARKKNTKTGMEVLIYQSGDADSPPQIWASLKKVWGSWDESETRKRRRLRVEISVLPLLHSKTFYDSLQSLEIT